MIAETESHQVADDRLELAFIRAVLMSRWSPTLLRVAERTAQAREFSWERTVVIAQHQRVEPLLYIALRDTPWVASAILARWHATYTRTALQNTFYLYELNRIVASLARAAVPVVVLKGAALAERMYGNVGLRPMLDIDLLAHHRDVERALEQLAAMGYRPLGAELHAGTTLAYENEIALVKAGNIPVAVELHWDLVDSPFYQQHLDTYWFWAHSKTDSTTGFRAFTPEAQLLHLCAHLMMHHRGDGLLWQHDIVALLHNDQIDWAVVLDCTRRFHLVLAVSTVLTELAAVWGAPVPADVLTRLAAMQPSVEEEQVFAWLTADTRSVAARFWSDLVTLPNWPARLRFCWSNLFPSTVYMVERYSITFPLFLPFYYLYRWWRGLKGIFVRRSVRR